MVDGSEYGTLTHADRELLATVQQDHFRYLVRYQHPQTRLVLDRSGPESPSSIAAIGFALTAYGVAERRGWCTQGEAFEFFEGVMTTLLGGPDGTDPRGSAR